MYVFTNMEVMVGDCEAGIEFRNGEMAGNQVVSLACGDQIT